MQYFAVQEVEGVATGGDGPNRVFFRLRDGLQELAYLGQAQFPGVTFAVEENEAAAPVSEAGCGGLGVAPLPGGLLYLVEQPRWGRRDGLWGQLMGRVPAHANPPGRLGKGLHS